MEKWNIVLVVYVGALCNAAFCSPRRPANVFFYSTNLQNVLHWHPRNKTPPNTYYTVQYAIYGETEARRSGGGHPHWRAAPQCTRLEVTRCDLTNQTWDREQSYNAKVRAEDQSGLSKWRRTQQRFDPKSDTVLGPLSVTLEVEENSAIVSIKAPMRYQPDKHKPETSMLELYPQMTYNLSVRIADGNNLTRHIPLSSGRYVYRLMDYNSEYCFSAKARFISIPLKSQPSAWHCIKTPQDPVIGQLWRMVVGIVVPLFCICVLGVGGYFFHYLLWGKKEKWPHALEPPRHHYPPPTFPPEKVHLVDFHHAYDSELSPVIKTCLSDVRQPQPPIGVLPDLLSYAPQGPAASLEPDAPWERGQESGGVTYGFVGGVPVTGGQEGVEEPGEALGNGDEGARRGRRQEEEEEEEEEAEEDAGRIHRDLESRALVLPEAPRWWEGGFDGWMLGERESASGGGEEQEEAQVVGAEEGREGVRLENVFVRQGSEQEREAAREREWETDTLLANWSLVVHMDE